MGFREISTDKSLRYFGAFLALTHFVCFYAWVLDAENPLVKTVFNDLRALCWPGTELCVSSRAFMLDWGLSIAIVYLSLAIFSFLSFFKSQTTKQAMYFLAGAWIIQCLIRFQDYRFMGNFHYMNAWTHIFFLLFSNRKKWLAILVVSFYVSASLIKFNKEWLSGESFIREPVLHGFWLKVACVYVIILELVFVPLLLFVKSKVYRYATFAQLIIFHLFSWHIVGYLYPLTMFCLISIFPLQWIFGDNKINKSLKINFSEYWPLGFIVIFWFFQLIPWLIRGPAELTGEGRLFSSNMLDSRSRCENYMPLYYNDKTIEVSDYGYDWGLRIACDPWLQYQLALNHCRLRSAEDPTFMNMDWYMLSKRSVDSDWQISVHIENFCTQKIAYSAWRHNDWIQLADFEGEFIKTKNNILETLPIIPPTNAKTWRIQLPHILRNSSEKVPVFMRDTAFYIPMNTGWLWKIASDGRILWKHYFNSSVLGIFPSLEWNSNKLSLMLRNGRRYEIESDTGRPLKFFPANNEFPMLPEPELSTTRWKTSDSWKVILVGDILSASR